MKNPDLYNEDHSATYCPEDDKLRLYVGRVPRPEYEALRAEGWTSTPKQGRPFPPMLPGLAGLPDALKTERPQPRNAFLL